MCNQFRTIFHIILVRQFLYSFSRFFSTRKRSVNGGSAKMFSVAKVKRQLQVGQGEIDTVQGGETNVWTIFSKTK